ncbi:hypothetical protein QA328_10455, partial [Glaesserella parasuis]|nr:hypothetical protein [Glaesserella parasuis]
LFYSGLKKPLKLAFNGFFSLTWVWFNICKELIGDFITTLAKLLSDTIDKAKINHRSVGYLQFNAGCIAHIGIADIQGQLISQKGRQRI